jgi:hypothetical protein
MYHHDTPHLAELFSNTLLAPTALRLEIVLHKHTNKLGKDVLRHYGMPVGSKPNSDGERTWMHAFAGAEGNPYRAEVYLQRKTHEGRRRNWKIEEERRESVITVKYPISGERSLLDALTHVDALDLHARCPKHISLVKGAFLRMLNVLNQRWVSDSTLRESNTTLLSTGDFLGGSHGRRVLSNRTIRAWAEVQEKTLAVNEERILAAATEEAERAYKVACNMPEVAMSKLRWMDHVSPVTVRALGLYLQKHASLLALSWNNDEEHPAVPPLTEEEYEAHVAFKKEHAQ